MYLGGRNPLHRITGHTEIRAMRTMILTLLLTVPVGCLAAEMSSVVLWRGEELALIVLLGVLCVAPIIVAARRNQLDVFEPVYVFSAVFFLVDVVGAIAMIQENQGTIFSIPLREHLPSALVFCTAGLLAAYAGYYGGRTWLGRGRNLSIQRLFQGPYDRRFVFFWSIVGLLASTAFYSFWFYSSGGSFSSINRTLSDENWYAPLSGSRGSVYFWMFRNCWPALIFVAWSFAPSASWRYLLGGAWAATAAIYFLDGNRGDLFLLLGATAILWYLRQKRRPSLLTLATVFVLLMALSGFMVLTRGPGAADVSTSDLFRQAMGEFTERNSLFGVMVTAKLIPDHEPYMGFRILENTLISWIPRSLWPDKPTLGLPKGILDHFKHIQHSTIGALGYFYAGFGVPGVLVGFFLLGLLNRLIYEYWRSDRDGPFRQIFLALWPMFLLIFIERGDPAFFVTRFLYQIGPLFVVWNLSVPPKLPWK